LLLTSAGHEFLHVRGSWVEKPIPDDLLCGLPLFWWDRIGKIMEAVGAFFIVFEIYGYGRTNQAFKSVADQDRSQNVPAQSLGHIRRAHVGLSGNMNI
jgi:hypothetical protein